MKKRYIIIALVVVLVISGLVLFLSRRGTGLLEVTAPNETPGNAVVNVTVEIDKQEPETFELRAGQSKTLRLKAGTVAVRGSAEDLKAVDVVEVKSSETSKVTTPSGSQHSINLLGNQAKFCPLIVGETVFSYNCNPGGSGQIIRHASPSNQPLFGGQSFVALEPHKNGLLGFLTTELTTLRYIDPTAQTIPTLALPAAVRQLLYQEFPTLVTPDQPGSSRFALIFAQANKIYLFGDTNDQNPLDLDIGQRAKLNDEGRVFSGSFSGDQFILYLGANEDPHDNEEVEPEGDHVDQSTIKTQVNEYDPAGEPSGQIDLPDGFSAAGLYKLSASYYLANWRDGGAFYYYQDGKLNEVYKFNDIARWAIQGGKAYFEEGGSLFEFVPASGGLFGLHSVFSSSELRLSGVYETTKGIVFTAFVKTVESEPLNIYQLSDKLASSDENLPGVAAPSKIAYVGLDNLLDNGVTSQQVDALKIALDNYASGKKIQQISIVNVTPVPRDRSSASRVFLIDFVVSADRTMMARMEFFDLSSIRLYLTNPTSGSQIYDSQVVTVQ
jgi:hypothetical protein